MNKERVLLGEQIEACVRDGRKLQAQYLSDFGHGAHRMRCAAGIAVAALALIALASFSPFRNSASPELPAISPVELTAGLKNMLKEGSWSPH